MSSITWTRGTSPASALWTPSGPKNTLMTLRSSTTRRKSASSSVRPSSAGTHALSSLPLPRVSLLLSSGRRPRPRVLPVTICFPRGFMTGRQQVTARLTADIGARAGGDQQDGGGGSSRAWTEGASGREYPAEPQVVHREGPRENAGYAYRGTIVGEASNPEPADPGVPHRGSRSSAARCCGSTGVGEPRAGHVNTGEAPLASPMGESG